MIVPISYPLQTGSPVYPGTPALAITAEKSMANGDSANTSMISMSSHAGTHIDVPRHFCPNGRSIRDLLRRVNVFSPAYCIDLPAGGDECIGPEILEKKLSGREDAEAILLRTGSWQQRDPDPHAYSAAHPWIPAAVPALLRKRCPRLRILGIDTISISTPSHRQEGRESHRAFLCDEKPICLLEDADLSSISTGETFALTIIPWILDDLDGVPVTAFLICNPC
jgi:arylformamidase